MIGEILPTSVCWSHSFADRVDAVPFPEELAAVAGAVPERRAEFATVRACAREALAELGVEPAPVLPDENRAPRWPAGVVGAMTHCQGYRAAAVARADVVLTLGIDAEPNAALPPDVIDLVARPEDLTGLPELPAGWGISWERLLFSAKESVFKAWYPVRREWLDFQEASVRFRPDGTFEVRLLKASAAGSPLETLTGRWISTPQFLATAIVVER
ncbi:MAG TPA: 4'-phosphopantetheinyl transferase superfamily protein [Nocardioides sp.]|jgi:4'-phosphopantetheinyl transferase EntD